MTSEPTEPPRVRRSHQPRVLGRRRRRRRRVVAAVVVVLAGLGVWLVVSGLQAKSALESARTEALAARAAVLAGDPATAGAQARRAAADAATARSQTDSLPWLLASAVPWIGRPADATRQISAAVDDLAQQVLLPAADAAQVLSPSSLRPTGGSVDLAALTAARPTLDSAAAAAATLQARVEAIPSAWLPQVEDARAQLVDQTAGLTGLLQNTSTAAALLPTMLGGSGPRSYFVAFQTNAEARGTGGLVGAFGVLHATSGALRLEDRGANTGLQRGNPATAAQLGPDFDQLYGSYDATSSWVNSNLSAHFPYAGAIWTNLWAQQTGEQLDGAIATDPVALSYVLGAVGPVTLPSGEVVTADNVVALTESDVYARFPDDAARKAYLQSISTTVLGTITTSAGGDTAAVLRALGRAAGEGRIAVWSVHPEEQAVLETTPLAHEVPDDAAPYAGVVVNNSANGKLDYYLQRDVAYRAGTCTGDARRSTVTVTLTSTAPAAGLPPYVTIQNRPGPGPVGSNRSNLALYATEGAQLLGVTVDGAAATAAVGAERGHPVFTVDVALPPGATVVVSYTLAEPTAPGAARVPVQPLVGSATTTTAVPDCATG